MRNYNLVLFLLILTGSCQPDGAYFENATCIVAVNTIDAVDGLKENMTLVIQGNRILRCEKTADLALSSDNNIIDGKGKFVIPGLWDAHVHFAYLEELAPSMFDLFLGYGITSVRDTGGRIDFVKKWQLAAQDNPTEAPRVMIAGPLIDGMPNVYDGSPPAVPPLSVGTATVDEAIDLVERLDSIGVDLIKAYEMLSPEQFSAIAKKAREKGLKVTGHVPLSMDVVSASNAGLNSLEHLRNLELSTARNAKELHSERQKILAEGKNLPGSELRSKIHDLQRTVAYDDQDTVKIDEVLNVLAKNQTWQIPTLALNTGSVRRYFSRSDWIESFRFLPKDIEANWQKGVTTFGETTLANKKRTDWTLKIVDQINKKGIPIMAGTDTPIFYLTPGLSLHEELVVLVDAGLSPIQAIETATLNPAKYFNMENELGLVKEGYLADLVLLEDNPLTEIQHTKKINAVIRNGKIYLKKDIDDLFKRLEEN